MCQFNYSVLPVRMFFSEKVEKVPEMLFNHGLKQTIQETSTQNFWIQWLPQMYWKTFSWGETHTKQPGRNQPEVCLRHWAQAVLLLKWDLFIIFFLPQHPSTCQSKSARYSWLYNINRRTMYRLIWHHLRFRCLNVEIFDRVVEFWCLPSLG